MFDWDDANRAHILIHRVEPYEAEEAMRDPAQEPTRSYNWQGEVRAAIIGMTRGKRLLHVVWTERGQRIRVLHARNATRWETRLYFRR